ncbi:MAG: hypothetical protein PHH41_05050 [Sulfurimonas sp.]|nr:hypothetical protein [Sulfurimonas sp.]MDD5202491.1 hypothetical protein [Sulfurimonas sp.]
MQANAIKTERYFDNIEISQHLLNVEYIIMVAPAPEKFKQTPIHFTLFLNTSEHLPHEVQEAVLGKFLYENKIGNPAELMSQLMPVGFGMSTQETAMPMLLVKPEDRATIPHVPMFVMDFLADSDNFDEAKIKNLTGWSYSYN